MAIPQSRLLVAATGKKVQTPYQCRPVRHCERSEASQGEAHCPWIASSPCGLLAMTPLPASRDAAHGLEPRARVNLRLREHRRLRAEPLDDPAHEWADARRGHQHRRLALAPGVLESLAHESNELGELGRLHGDAALLALADDRLGERLFPFGGEHNQRQVARRRGVRSEEHTSELQSHSFISY